MKSIYSKMILRTLASVSMLLMAGTSLAATTTVVNLTAQRMSASMPDGTAVPMWGYCTTPAAGSCAAAWAPGPTITVPYDASGTNLQINLQNMLPMPTSIVILGQYGGGLGGITRMPSPLHAGQTHTTFPSNGLADIPFIPPAQADRVKSFATEVAAGVATPTSLTWNNLRPGTYIYETGTLPSIQAPMGLYGVLIVTQAPVAVTPAATFVSGNAYPGASKAVPYDSDTTMLFSEIDPVQNRAVDAAAMDNADLTKRFNDPTCSPNAKCYPAAVNFTPAYFLINGQAFDKTHPEKSTFPVAVTPAASSGNLLVRMLNAGLRTHTPSVVGLGMTLAAEDGNVAPGNSKIQNEVLLTAGKTYDVLLNPLQVSPAPATGAAYAPATFAVFDRQLSLTTANQPDGGMQGIIQIAGGALNAAVTPMAVNDIFAVPLNTSINGNVRLNDVAVMRAAVVAGNDPTKGTLSFNADGSFVYTPAPGVSGATDTFTYQGNDGATNIATVTLNIAGIKGPPVAKDDIYNSAVSSLYKVSRPGVLTNDTDPSAYTITAVLAGNGNCAAVTLNADGSFSATPTAGASSCIFSYQAKNSQGTLSAAAANVTVNFPVASGIVLSVMDAGTKAPITDYRWTIQEDLTFKVDPSGTPLLGTRTLGTSFHTSHMPVIATGCVGNVSCGFGQSAAVAPQIPTNVGDVYLDPTKHYYISILPGDAGDPAVVDGAPGHMMGGVNIKPADIIAKATKSIMVQPTPLEPAQLSIYIYEDNSPVNGQYDQNEVGLGGFSLILVDAVGRSGDPAGQQTFDAANMPVTNSLLGKPGCPNELNTATAARTGNNLVGEVYTCPNAPVRVAPVPANFPTVAAYNAALAAYQALLASDSVTYALAGHALIKNITPARYDVIAHPGAARVAAGEIWWQTETLEGTPAQDAFTGVREPVYFQEFGPPGFHTTIGYVNPKQVAKYAADNRLTGTHNLTGKITNGRMSRPADITLWDSGSYALLNSTTCQVALNSQGGSGATIAIAQCDQDGNFVLKNVPAGIYEIAIWDQWLDQIIQKKAVTIADAAPVEVALGNIPVLGWFTQHDQNMFMDTNRNGIYDIGEIGLANVLMTNRYRDGSISNQTLTDSSGNGLLAELFPLFNWYVSEADTTRFKQTGVNVIVDGGGPVDTVGPGAGLWASIYATGVSSNRVEIPGAYSYGNQGFISQRNTINWGRVPYAQGENGGIQGFVVYGSTRPVDDQRYNVQTLWEPLIPRVTVNLYRKQKLADGSDTLILVDTTKTSSWDDFVSAVDANGKQLNMQCPGQVATDPFVLYTLAAQNPGGPVDINRCYDGFHNWNQVQAAPYDGRYSFPSANCTGCIANPDGGARMLSAGEYVVETVVPPGYEIVKEEDKNILIGDAFNAAIQPQFGPLGSLFILPDQATLNNANPNNPVVGGVQTNPTSNLGVQASMVSMPECVGSLHRVPDYLSIFPQAQQVAPFAGMDRPLCDRKLVKLGEQMQASANFFVFTPVPLAANGTGVILNDAAPEIVVVSPDFGEKATVPFVPVSIKDFMGREISRVYSDQWGAYNVMTPSSWLVNPPTPSGYGPNMLVTCMNDPGPIPDPKDPTKMITDPQYNASYSNFCYTLPFMPGRTTYLDTPVLPIAAFAAGYNPVDCAYPGGTAAAPGVPAILRVDSSAGFGPYLPVPGGTLTIAALGDQEVPNPGYAGPFATSGPASKRTLIRHYGFGSTKGTVRIGNRTIPAANVAWSDTLITATVPAGTPSGELVITTANNQSSVDTVTVTIENRAPTRVQGATGGSIQAAIDAATPGDLILVDAGTYNELLIMWKPVRLQGVGASSVIVNAAKYPTTKLETWRPRINDLFSVDVTTGLSTATALNPSQIDALPGQTVTGGVILLEPTVLATEEGAGITVLAKNLPVGQCNVNAGPISTTGRHINESNFLCAPSRIDGLSVTGGDSGGGIYVNGWAHNLEIANNRVYGNSGAFNGGVRIGIPYLEIPAFPGLVENANGNLVGAPILAGGVLAGWGLDKNVKIHHNAITKNGVVEGPTGGGGAGGGLSICTGTDGYSVDHNWICGNFSSSDGGGIGHIGFSQGGQIVNNNILFNQSFQQTTTVNGGGIAVIGEPSLFGATVSPGTGNLIIDSNLIRGNLAETGHGGGIRLQQVNGSDIQYEVNPALWHKVVVTNNIIDNNVAGWAGGGIAVADTLNSSITNNTVASNDSVGIAGVLLAVRPEGASQTGTGKASPAGVSTEPTSTQLLAVRNGLSRISSPVLTDNIVWQNRSFYYSVVAGASVLCASNDTSVAGCNQLGDQAVTGQCVAGAKYWDLGIVGDTSAAVSGSVIPAHTVRVTSSTRVNATTVQIVIPADTLLNGSTVTIAGFTGGTAAQLAALNSPHVVSNVVTTAATTTFRFTTAVSFTVAQFNALVKTNVTAVLPAAPGPVLNPAFSVITAGYAGNGNSNTDPQLVDFYCNGARVTPEYPQITIPTGVKNMQVGAAVDESNNYVGISYGPLYMFKPTDSTGTAYVPFGNYHIQTTSPAINRGIPVVGVTHDFDGAVRPQGVAVDIGADEVR